MKIIRISEEVWDEIAQRGKFGETEDDVLRRVFGLNKNIDRDSMRSSFLRSPNKTKSTMSSRVTDDGRLVVDFQGGSRNEWKLSSPTDKAYLRKIIDEALSFADDNEATLGQRNAIRKALTDAGFHLTK